MIPEFRPPGLDAPVRPRKRELRELAEVMSQIAEEARGLPGPYLRAFLPALADAQAELAAGLRHWLRNVEDGELRFTAQQFRVALLQIRGVLEQLQGRIPAEMEGTLRVAGEAAGAMGIEHLTHEVARFGAVFGHSMRPIQLNQAAIIAQKEHQLIPRFRNSANRYARGIADDIRHQLSVGMVRGETFTQMTNRLVRLGGPRGWVALRGTLGEPGSYAEFISEGLFRKYRYWAERIVRTEAIHSYNVHHLAGLEEADREDPGYEKRWDATADRNLCDICRELDGMVVPIKADFPLVKRPAPPGHPCCMCGLTPWRKEWSSDPTVTRTVPKEADSGGAA